MYPDIVCPRFFEIIIRMINFKMMIIISEMHFINMKKLISDMVFNLK